MTPTKKNYYSKEKNTEAMRRYRNSKKGTIAMKLQGSKRNAKTKRLEHNLTLEFLTALWNGQNDRCAISGLPLAYTGDGWGTGSIDRINPTKGYTEDNVQWICWRINDAKSNMQNDDFISMCATVTHNNFIKLNKFKR